FHVTGVQTCALPIYQGLFRAGWNDWSNAGVMFSRAPTPNLIWESNAQADVGVEFTLFHRVYGAVEWFNRKSKDLIFNRPLAPSRSEERRVGQVQRCR